jgi:hypothetical protein
MASTASASFVHQPRSASSQRAGEPHRLDARVVERLDRRHRRDHRLALRIEQLGLRHDPLLVALARHALRLAGGRRRGIGGAGARARRAVVAERLVDGQAQARLEVGALEVDLLPLTVDLRDLRPPPPAVEELPAQAEVERPRRVERILEVGDQPHFAAPETGELDLRPAVGARHRLLLDVGGALQRQVLELRPSAGGERHRLLGGGRLGQRAPLRGELQRLARGQRHQLPQPRLGDRHLPAPPLRPPARSPPARRRRAAVRARWPRPARAASRCARGRGGGTRAPFRRW